MRARADPAGPQVRYHGQVRGGTWAAVAVVVGACGGEGSAPDGGPTADAGLSTVSGSMVYRTHLEGSEPVATPVDLTGEPIAAWVPTAGGGPREIRGVGRADGRFVIEHVPELPVYVQVGSTYVHTDEREIDLGSDRIGRPDWDFTAEGAILRIHADGLQAWQALDGLALSSVNLGVHIGFLGFYASPPIETGAVTLSESDFEIGGFPRVDATRGDRLSLYQTSGTEQANSSYWSIVRKLDIDPVTLEDGETTIAGTFEPIPPTEELDLDWSVRAWQSLADETHPEGRASSGWLSLLARPALVDPTFGLFDARLIELYGGSSVAGSLAYGDPFPVAWPRTIEAEVAFGVERTLPGGEETFLRGSMRTVLPLADLEPEALRVLLSPPRRPKIDGAVAYADRPVPGSAELSWEPPSIGAPTAYRVEVVRFERLSASSAYPFTVATLFTAATSIAIPPGLLEPGEPHGIVIYALHQPNGDPVRAPFRVSLPSAETPAFTGLLTP